METYGKTNSDSCGNLRQRRALKIATQKESRASQSCKSPCGSALKERAPTRQIPKLTDAQISRFYSLVKKGNENECWEYIGYSVRGYGRFSCGKAGKFLAHRVAKILATPEKESGMLVCHTCDNPPCCNPKHLYWGTVNDNMQDTLKRGRMNRPTGDNHHSRLTR